MDTAPDNNPFPMAGVQSTGTLSYVLVDADRNVSVTVPNGKDIALGALADAAWNGVPGAASLIAVCKAIWNNITSMSAQLPASLGGKTGANSLSIVPATDAVFETVSAGYSFTNISTATTTVVKNGAGTLHAVIVNSKGTVASTLTVYDNTAGSGTIIAIIDSLNLSGTFEYDIDFATGCTIVSTGTVAPNFTVSYR
jgi:hypothetical protein